MPHGFDAVQARTDGTAEVLFLIWRDCQHPEGGGSEIYVETVARALAAAGNRVTIRSAAFPGGAAQEWVHGVRIVRGGSKLSVYPQALRELRSGRLGTPDVVVDVQNGISFGSPLARVAPTVVLVHHVHREQWPVIYGPVRSRLGWWLESRAAPRIYRDCQYVAVSAATAHELASLGVDPGRVAVVPNGMAPRPPGFDVRSDVPRIVVLGRLVPHKRVEHVLAAVAAMRERIPGLEVSIVGSGWWHDEAVAEAARLGVADLVTFRGFVDEAAKQAELAAAWVLALPSLKEGWGLVITEAAAHGVPAVAYRSAGGVTESIVDGVSGLLVDGGPEQFGAALEAVLTDQGLRARLTDGALGRMGELSWQATAQGFAAALSRSAGRTIEVGADVVAAELHATRSAAVHPTA